MKREFHVIKGGKTMLKCFKNMINSVKEVDDFIQHNYPQAEKEFNESKITSEDKLQKVYQSIRDIFGDNAQVSITVNGDTAHTSVRYY